MSPRILSRPQPRLCLPIFDARSALSVINVLDSIISAIWTAHGDVIVEMQTDLASVPIAPKPIPDDDGF
jgi:hypothetical protein